MCHERGLGEPTWLPSSRGGCCTHTHTTRASELSMWEQLSLAAFLQKYWADNQVGVCVCVSRASCLLNASNLCCPLPLR